MPAPLSTESSKLELKRMPRSIGLSAITEEKLEPDGCCIGFSFKVKELDEPGPIPIGFAFAILEEKIEPNSVGAGSNIGFESSNFIIGFSGSGSVGVTVTTLELEKFVPGPFGYGFEIIMGNFESSSVGFAITEGNEKLEPAATIGKKLFEIEPSLAGFAFALMEGIPQPNPPIQLCSITEIEGKFKPSSDEFTDTIECSIIEGKPENLGLIPIDFAIPAPGEKVEIALLIEFEFTDKEEKLEPISVP